MRRHRGSIYLASFSRDYRFWAKGKTDKSSDGEFPSAHQSRARAMTHDDGLISYRFTRQVLGGRGGGQWGIIVAIFACLVKLALGQYLTNCHSNQGHHGFKKKQNIGE